VGTAFNVNLTSARVEVIVTEGRVGVAMTEVGGPGAKTTVYEAGLRLALVVRSSDQKRSVVVVSEAMISWVDFTPTILDIAGVKNVLAPPFRAGDPEGEGGGAPARGAGQKRKPGGLDRYSFHGRSFLPTIEGGKLPGWELIFASHQFHEITNS
jgi:N-sulfoglucosamine sulfohydrolase